MTLTAVVGPVKMAATHALTLAARRGKVVTATQPDPLAWRSLPSIAQAYVAAVSALGTVLFWTFVPLQYPQPVLFGTLLITSCLTSIWKGARLCPGRE